MKCDKRRAPKIVLALEMGGNVVFLSFLMLVAFLDVSFDWVGH
jgi:hypothetical protein